MRAIHRIFTGTLLMITAVGIASANTITFSAAIPTQTTPFVNDAALSNFNTA